MHIAIVGPAYPYRGGIAHFSNGLAQALRSRGHCVDIHTFSRQYPDKLFPGKTQREDALDRLPHGTTARLDSINPISWWREALRIGNSGADTVIFAYWLPFFAPAYIMMAWMLRRQGVEVLCIAHNVLPHSRHFGDRELTRMFFNVCDRLIVLSSSVARDARSIDTSTRVEEANHPVYQQFGERIDASEARRKLDVPEDAPLILFFGFIRRYKGLATLLRALPIALESVPELRVLVAGEFYEDEAELRRLATVPAANQRVIFHDHYIPEADVGLYFSAADVVVQPYVSATQSGVAQIAFSFGVPLIVTDVGALAEVVPHEKAGLVVQPQNPEELAEAIMRYFQDRPLRDRLVKGVEEQRRLYSWDVLCQIIDNTNQTSRNDAV